MDFDRIIEIATRCKEIEHELTLGNGLAAELEAELETLIDELEHLINE